MEQARDPSLLSSFVLVDLDEVLRKSREEVERLDERFVVELQGTHGWQRIAPVVFGNPTLLSSLVSSLMENACRYSSDHCARVSLAATDTELRVHFQDNGISIAPEDHDRPFEPVSNARDQGSVQEETLELPVACRIAELHRGSIILGSNTGTGSHVITILPRAGR